MAKYSSKKKAQLRQEALQDMGISQDLAADPLAILDAVELQQQKDTAPKREVQTTMPVTTTASAKPAPASVVVLPEKKPDERTDKQSKVEPAQLTQPTQPTQPAHDALQNAGRSA